jgi:hypothetical protein
VYSPDGMANVEDPQPSYIHGLLIFSAAGYPRLKSLLPKVTTLSARQARSFAR